MSKAFVMNIGYFANNEYVNKFEMPEHFDSHANCAKIYGINFMNACRVVDVIEYGSTVYVYSSASVRFVANTRLMPGQ